jgi:general secretion pathway protein F/type IV pilus assembly protein PilC
MALFRYRALTAEGKRISGVIDADSYLSAKDRLRKDQILVTGIDQLDKKQKTLRLSSDMLLNFTRELGQLLRAGLPLYESLLTIEEKYRGQPIHPLFLDLCDRLKGGSALSACLKNYPDSFDTVYLSMIQAAEASASLPYVFDQLSQLITKQQKLKKQLVSALSYPALLTVFCFVVTLSLLCFVVPSIQELFDGRSVHPLTKIVLGLSRFVTNNAAILASSFILCVVLVIFAIRSPKLRISMQQALLRFPLFKTIVIQSALTRFCRTAAVLLSGGVTLIDSLTLAKRAMKNLLLEQVIQNASKKITEGGKLSEELKASPLIPSLVVRMLAIAEETGKLAPMLQNLADIYEEELEKNLSQLTTFLQPALLIILGMIVGLVILSVLIPLTDVSSFLTT